MVGVPDVSVGVNITWMIEHIGTKEYKSKDGPDNRRKERTHLHKV